MVTLSNIVGNTDIVVGTDGDITLQDVNLDAVIESIGQDEILCEIASDELLDYIKENLDKKEVEEWAVENYDLIKKD